MDLRQKWVKSFHTLEKLRGLKSNRAVMPRNTSSPKLNLIADGDIAKEHVKITTVREGVLIIVLELRLPKDEEEDFDEGFVHKLPPEILTKGHTVLVAAEGRDTIAEDVEFSDYLLNSTKHKYSETCYEYNQDHVFVVQGMKLFCELGKEYISCKKFRDQYLNISMAPLLNVIESKSANDVIDGVNRLNCKARMPNAILIDQDYRIMKAFSEAEVNIKETDLVLFEENKIRLKTCLVSGHNINGLPE